MEIREREIKQEFNEIMRRLGPAFRSDPTFEMAQQYIRGLMGPVERKNGWQMSEYLGETTPYRLQQFIYRSVYEADGIRDITRKYVVENIGEEDGVAVIDETGFLKQGTKSCGVARQYSGTAGRVENCQIGVFLTYASSKGHCPIDRRLYLPEAWAQDSERRKGAGVPEEVDFRTKPNLALRMIKEATEAGVPYRWITGDCVYGDNRYNGWYRHITLACVALALLTVLSSKSLDTKSFQEHNPSASSLEAFKKGRNLRV